MIKTETIKHYFCDFCGKNIHEKIAEQSYHTVSETLSGIGASITKWEVLFAKNEKTSIGGERIHLCTDCKIKFAERLLADLMDLKEVEKEKNDEH